MREIFLSRFLTLPESESANIDLRQAAVVIISHLDRLAKPQLPTGSYAPKTNRTKQLQQILTLGSFSVSSENYGFTSEHTTEQFPILGTGSKYSTTFVDLGPNASIKQMIFSEKQVYILTTLGEVFTVDNEIISEPKVEPVDIAGCDPGTVIQIAGLCEGKYLFALNEKREVFVLIVADGRSNRGDVTLKIQALSDKFIKNIYCGVTYCAAVTVSGGLYTFGRNVVAGCASVISEEKFVPNAFAPMFGQMVVDVALSTGDSSSLCVTSDGSVYAWNDIDLGKAGNSSYSGCSQFPVQVEGLARICRVFSCTEFNVALSFDGSVYVWNNKNGGRPCSADMSDEKAKTNAELSDYLPHPQRIDTLEGKNIVDVAVGSAHCLLLTSNGEVYGFGRNDYNQVCPKSISSATMITTPIQVTPPSLQTTGITCGPAQSILWSNTSTSGIARKIPFIVDLSESTFRLIDQLLAVVCAVTSEMRHLPPQESECITVGALNLLRLQLHSLITNNINPQTVGLGEGSRLLTSLKTRILSLAGGPTILKTMQDAAQWTLQVGWSVFLPTAAERAQTLTSLLPSDPSASTSTSGHRFMTDLLVGSLMAEEGLQTALKQAINSEPEDSSSGHNLPLLHLIKQLLRNNAALTQARLGQLLVGPYIKSEDDYTHAESAEFPSPSLDLLHRFQRLLLSHLHQSKNEDLAAEALLAKYMQQIITLSVATLTKANEILLQGKEGIVPVLAADISDTLLYELIVGLILLHRDCTTTILPSFEWTKLFVPLLNCLDSLNRIICDADIQDTDNMGWPAIFCRGSPKLVSAQDDAVVIRQCDIENHILSGGKWIVISGHVYDVEGYQ